MAQVVDVENLESTLNELLENETPVSREEIAVFAREATNASRSYDRRRLAAADPRQIATALLNDVKAARGYEWLLKKEDGNAWKNTRDAAKCNDYSGRKSFDLAVCLGEDVYYEFSMRFKIHAAEFYIMLAREAKKPWMINKSFSSAGACFDRAGQIAAGLGNYKYGAELKEKAAYYFERGKNYNGAIWALSRTRDALENLGDSEARITTISDRIAFLIGKKWGKVPNGFTPRRGDLRYLKPHQQHNTSGN